MLTNSYPDYESKTDWTNQCKIDMNIRDLQAKYPTGCKCCGIIYNKEKFSTLVNSHFKTNKHKKLCIQPQNNRFQTDFKDVNDINVAYEEKCKENKILKKLNYEYKQDLDKLNNILYSPATFNLIDI